jgi:hypothetical protein
MLTACAKLALSCNVELRNNFVDAVRPATIGRERIMTQAITARRTTMTKALSALVLAGALAATGGLALAHHSFAMFDTDHPTELTGTVQEFKFTSPHTFILLKVKGTDGAETVWNLEGASPSALVREGWSSKTLNAGDELKMTIDPLRSGAPGGAWQEKRTAFKSGQPIVPATH